MEFYSVDIEMFMSGWSTLYFRLTKGRPEDVACRTYTTDPAYLIIVSGAVMIRQETAMNFSRIHQSWVCQSAKVSAAIFVHLHYSTL
jgi:hypothetical protein